MLLGVAGDDAGPPERAETLTARVLAAAANREIPLRTIIATVSVVVVTGLVLLLAWTIRTDLLLFGVAVFIAVLLEGPVAWLARHGLRRTFAVSLVFTLGVLAFLGIAYLFGSPLVSHVKQFVTSVQHLVKQAQLGRGWIGGVINRLHLHNWIANNAPKLNELAGNLASPALHFGAAAASTLLKLATIAMLAFFLLLDLPKIWNGFLSLLSEEQARRVGRVAHEASTGVTGYMLGNVLTSVMTGIVVFVSLLVFGVPYAGLVALWAALVDLLPVVGGLLAALPTIILAALHSTPAVIGVTVIFVVWWQVENHVVNPIVMSRTVRMSKLLILIAVVVGATLGGRIGGPFGTFIGALVGIPVGSAIQVIVREARRTDVAAGSPSSSPLSGAGPVAADHPASP